MLIEEGTTESPEDPLPILFPDPEESKGFQPFLFSDRYFVIFFFSNGFSLCECVEKTVSKIQATGQSG